MQPDTARAAFLWAVVALVWSALGAGDRAPVCVEPAERSAVNGHTTAVRCGAASHQPGLRGPARRLFGLGVDLNCSDLATLETLAGIGTARARAIIAERDRGRFRSVDDLQRVRGIGPKTVARLRTELIAAAGSAEPASVPSPGCRSMTRRPRQRDAEERL